VGDIDRVVQPAMLGMRRYRIHDRRQQSGAVMALEVDRDALFERVAHQIALVLQNVPPGTIPVQSPRKFLLTVNLDAAKRVGIDVPRSLLLQAEVVIADGR
jgi:putative ABC transport system substrate-binding protein